MATDLVDIYIRRPLLVKGIKAAGFGLIRFLTITSYAFSYLASAVMLLEGANRRKIPWHINYSRFVALPKSIIIKLVFKAQKTKKNNSQGLQTTTKIVPQVHKKTN